MFEPSRTAAACLADAYARVVPVRRRAVRSDHGPPAAPDRAPRRRTDGGVQ
jgi:hypothetical protein